MERHMDRELAGLKEELLKMGTLAEKAIFESIEALRGFDKEKAWKIIEEDSVNVAYSGFPSSETPMRPRCQYSRRCYIYGSSQSHQTPSKGLIHFKKIFYTDFTYILHPHDMGLA